ncbi:MAG: DEAD/DEAH box helicase [Actinomycetota bacterium]|nr:DEAD/DEAH box helicase [Actinomycetota bacterium]
MNELAGLGPGFVVFDEVQLVKVREEHAVSRRREALEALVSELAERDPGLCVLGMSATPVINNLLEARKLLEIVTGRSHADLATQPTVDNALAVHRALMVNGFRYRPRYEIEIKPIPVEIKGNALLPELTNVGGVLALEQTLLPAKLEAITPYVREGTLVYTHYVTGMVGPIRDHLERLGFKVGLYTGDDKSGLEPFKARALDVLIGSKSVGTGLNGRQTVCDQIVMFSLPWTSAKHEQILGRVRRQGSAFGSVSEIVPQVVLDYDGDRWSWDKNREATIRYKRTLSDCAVDGKIPEAVRI